MSIKLLKRLSCGIISGVCCCLFCLLLATAANADVCFLPTGQCEAASANLSTGCSGFNLSEAKDEKGWSCTQCGGKWKCDKKQCKDDYKTDVRCSGTETKVCDETRKAGDESCCKCEDSATKCQHEGYVYKKTSTNENCTGECPYNSDYYESCECNAKYDKAKDADKCYEYNVCELGDLAGTKKYEQTSSLKKCESYEGKDQYAKTGDKILSNNDYTCVSKCEETCTGITYYDCSVKSNCNESEGKYATRELCEASLQHASVFDIFKKYIPNFNYTPNFNLISTSYAASLCPVDEVRKCVSCTNNCTRGAAYTSYPCCTSGISDCPCPTTGPGSGQPTGTYDSKGNALYYDLSPCCVGDNLTSCIGMAMNVDQNCVHCRTDDPTWRASGCEGYPCCLEEVDKTLLCRINLEKNCAKCDGECDRGSYSCCLDEPQITDCQIDVDRECAKCDGVCTNKIDCCDDIENSPCELKDGCWVAKQTNVDCTGCDYCIAGTCKSSGENRIISDSSTYEKCADSCGGKYKCKTGYTPSYAGSNQYKCVRTSGCYYDTVAQCKTAGYTYTAEERWWVQDEYMTHECEPCDCGGTEMNKCVPVGGGCESQYQSQCNSWGGTLKSSTSYVNEDVCHAVFGECDNKYWYCLKPGCSDSGSVTVYYDAPTNCNPILMATNSANGRNTSLAATNQMVPGTYSFSFASGGNGTGSSFTIRMGRGGTPATFSSGSRYTFSAGNEYWIVPSCTSGGGSGGDSGGGSGGNDTYSVSIYCMPKGIDGTMGGDCIITPSANAKAEDLRKITAWACICQAGEGTNCTYTAVQVSSNSGIIYGSGYLMSMLGCGIVKDPDGSKRDILNNSHCQSSVSAGGCNYKWEWHDYEFGY